MKEGKLTNNVLTEEYLINSNWQTIYEIIIEQAKTKGLNSNELAVLISAIKDTDGLNLTSHIRPVGLSTNQIKGYISSLSKKGIVICDGGCTDYPDFLVFPIMLENGDTYISGQDGNYRIDRKQ